MPSPLVIIIPAHNEERGLSFTLTSLKACREADCVVIADNCTDQTATIAREHGYRVIERNDLSKIGKPFALAYAFQHLIPEGYEYFAIVDADTLVEPHFASSLLETFKQGADAVQVVYTQQKEQTQLIQRFFDITFTGCNTLRPLGRQYWNLSCGILGNGFAINRETLLAVPFKLETLVEDLIYHIDIVTTGRKVIFCTDTTVRASVPSTLQGIRTQHARWEGGHLQALHLRGLDLFKRFLKGQYRLLEPLLDLLLPPLSIQALTVLMLFLFPWGRTYAWISLGVIVFYCAVTLRLRQQGWRDWATLLLTPFYLVWKIILLPTIVTHAIYSVWKGTERNDPQ